MDIFHVYLRQKKIGRHVAVRIIQHNYRQYMIWKKEKERIDRLTHSFAALKKFHILYSKEYWRALQLESLSREKLEKAAMYLDLPCSAKKAQLIKRIKSWLEQETFWTEVSAEAAAKGRDFQDKSLGQVFLCESEDHVSVEIESLRGKNVTNLAAGFVSHALYAFDSELGVAWLCRSGGSASLCLEQKKALSSDKKWLDPPIMLDSFAGETVEDICISNTDGVARTSSGNIFTWGSHATTLPSLSTCTLGQAIDISIGKHHIVAVYRQEGGDDTEVVSWGANTPTRSAERSAPLSSWNFHCVDALREHRITQVACGALHTLAISFDGKLYSWGCADGGRLGHEKSFLTQNEASFPREADSDIGPRLVGGILKSLIVVKIACGTWHSACVAIDTRDHPHGQVFTWGTGVYGQLGLGPGQVISNEPCSVKLPRHNYPEPVEQVACGTYHTAVLTGSNAIYTWGGCSRKHASNSFVPRRIELKASSTRKVGSLTCGRTFTAFSVRCFPGEYTKTTDSSPKDETSPSATSNAIRSDLNPRETSNDSDRHGNVDDEVDEERELYLFLHPKCRVCSQCDGFRPSHDRLSVCRQCSHEKTAHGKRVKELSKHESLQSELPNGNSIRLTDMRTSLTRQDATILLQRYWKKYKKRPQRTERSQAKQNEASFEAAGVTIQALARRFLARRRVYSLLTERYWKIIDPETGSPYFHDRLNGTSSWYKPKLLGSRDLRIERFES